MGGSRRTSAHLDALLAQPIAHRGLHACGGPGPVENSIAAAQAAIERGYAVECDVQMSRDGEAMVFHDADLDRLTAMSGRLVDRDAADLQRLYLRGSRESIPTLAQFLAAIAGRVPVVIEIKSMGGLALTRRVIEVIASYDGALALESFDPIVMSHCRASGVQHPVGLVGPPEAGADHDAANHDAAALAAADFLSWSIDHLAVIAHVSPLPLTTWTIRTADQVATARRHRAQIVFEGFGASPTFNDVTQK